VLKILFAIFVAQFNVSVEYFFSSSISLVYLSFYSLLFLPAVCLVNENVQISVFCLAVTETGEISDEFAFKDHRLRSRSFLEGSWSLGKIMSCTVAVFATRCYA